MKSKLYCKILAVGIILLFLGGVCPSSGVIINKRTIMPITRGNTLYVGGSGPGNYTKIQDAIDDAIDGDTVYVYSYSSPYYEDVEVDKSINLIGEEKDTTVIEGDGMGWTGVVYISSDWVNISGFTIQIGENGIYIESNYNTVTGNIIWDTSRGIYIRSNYNTIKGNVISNIFWGGVLFGGFTYSNIMDNTIMDNTITSCNSYGMHVYNSISTTIMGNTITSCGEYCIGFYGSSNNNIIYHNNFIDFGERAYDECDNIWDDGKYGNFWSDYEEIYPDAEKELFKPWMWDTPYEIEGGDNKDNCPLVNQWPNIKPRTIITDTPIFNTFLLRFFDMFPILQRMIELSR